MILYPLSQVGEATLKEGYSGQSRSAGARYDPDTLANQLRFGAPTCSRGFAQRLLQLSR